MYGETYYGRYTTPRQLFWSQADPSEIQITYTWAASCQNQHNDLCPQRDSDQSGHPPILIRVFAVRMKKNWVLSYPLSAQRRLWSDWADVQADLSIRPVWSESSLKAVILLVMSWGGSNFENVANRSNTSLNVNRNDNVPSKDVHMYSVFPNK